MFRIDLEDVCFDYYLFSVDVSVDHDDKKVHFFDLEVCRSDDAEFMMNVLL